MTSGSRTTASVPLQGLGFEAPYAGRRMLLRGLAGFVPFGLLGTADFPVAAAAESTRIAASSLVRPGDPVYGNPHGTVTIVDFYDIRCPPCRAMNLRIQKLLTTDHFLRYVPVDYPILGAASVLGVKALFAAAMQGKYDALRATLMRQKQKPDMAILKHDAKQVGLDWPKLELDMNGDKVAARIERNLRRGRALGIHGIPTFFVDAKRISGGLTYDDLCAVVAEAENIASKVRNS